MPVPGESLLCSPLEFPRLGQANRMQRGAWQLVVEHVRGGLAVLAHDGRQEHRMFVGAPNGGRLELRAQAPRYPVRVQLEETLTLTPKGRLRGYVAVPLPHAVVWRQNGDEQQLAELLPRNLQTCWLGPEHGYAHVASSRFFLELGGRGGEADAMVPVVLRNVGSHGVSPTELTLRLRTTCLRNLRARIVAAPRTLVYQGQDLVVERVHPFLGARR